MVFVESSRTFNGLGATAHAPHGTGGAEPVAGGSDLAQTDGDQPDETFEATIIRLDTASAERLFRTARR